eukprot:TRINITY_DN368_c0_g1_i1.p1 TRINITY_DN368_c0_g1~~TRINITY_DN368_c0_g1_i1.p1  ORF type:complete len:512 (+),score=171.26 TRINITY_DN368_c0_g1_i1:113-1648(+)
MWDPEYNKREVQEPLLKKVYHEKGPSSNYRTPVNQSAPPSPRSFNDVFFGLLFLITVIAFLSVSSLAFSRGRPSQFVPSSQWSIAQYTDRSQFGFQDAVAQAKEDRWIVLGSVLLSVLLGFLWIQLVKMFTKLFIYLTLFVGIGMVLASAVYFLTEGVQRNNSSMRIVSYVIFGVAVLLFVCLLFLRKKIALTHVLFKECCEGIKARPSLVFISLLVVGMFAAFSVFWTASLFFLYSVPQTESFGSQIDFNGNLVAFDTSIRNAMYFQVFAYFWIAAFISAVFQSTVAGSLSHWYFSRDPLASADHFGALPHQSLTNALTKSFGSLALGSLILAIFQFANFVLNSLRRANPNNRILRFVISIFQCILGFFEGLFKFVNRFAYIYIGMKGESFCSSAKNCHSLITRNYFNVITVDLLGWFVLFVGKLLGTAVSTTFCMILLQSLHRPLTGVTLSIVAIISFWVFNLFSQIIQVGVDTVFVSYLFDLERSKVTGRLLISNEIHHLLQEKSIHR